MNRRWPKRRIGWRLSSSKVEAPRQPSTAPEFDESYSFGGLPTGRGGKFTATEIPEAMAEMNEARVQAARKLKEERAGQ